LKKTLKKENDMNFMIFVVVVLIIEAVRFEIERRNRKAEKKKLVELISEVQQKTGNLAYITAGIRDKATEIIEKMEKKNGEFIEMIRNEFEKELEKAEEEKSKAVAELAIFVAAVKSLDDNYKRKIQFQLERIINKKKSQPKVKDENKKD